MYNVSADIVSVFCELLLFVVISPAVSEHYLIFNFTMHIDSLLDSHQSLIPFLLMFIKRSGYYLVFAHTSTAGTFTLHFSNPR